MFNNTRSAVEEATKKARRQSDGKAAQVARCNGRENECNPDASICRVVRKYKKRRGSRNTVERLAKNEHTLYMYSVARTKNGWCRGRVFWGGSWEVLGTRHHRDPVLSTVGCHARR